MYSKIPTSPLHTEHRCWAERRYPVGVNARILAAKQRDAEADTSTLEREIDELVYALYGLTPEEKALVQSASAGKLRRDESAAK